MVSLHALGKEILKGNQEQHKSLMEGLGALEVAIKQLVPAQPEGSSLPVMRMYEQNAGPMYGKGQPSSSVSAPSHAAPVLPPQVVPAMAAMPPHQEVPQPRFEVDSGAVGLPAAFHQGRKAPGYANARRAWKVVVQGAQGQARVRAVSPNCIRVDETPPANWIQEFGLGSITVGQYRHRILPDFCIEGAEPYPKNVKNVSSQKFYKLKL